MALVLEPGGDDTFDLGLAHAGEQSFLRGARVQRELAARGNGQPQGLWRFDPLEADASVTVRVQHGEQRGLARVGGQGPQDGEGDRAEIDHRSGPVAEG